MRDYKFYLKVIFIIISIPALILILLFLNTEQIETFQDKIILWLYD